MDSSVLRTNCLHLGIKWSLNGSYIAPQVKGIAPNQYHGAFYYLQMIILEEFSNKSKELFQHKCVQITEDDWDRLLKKANIPLKYRSRILEGWTADGEGAPRIIQKIDKDHFSPKGAKTDCVSRYIRKRKRRRYFFYGLGVELFAFGFTGVEAKKEQKYRSYDGLKMFHFCLPVLIFSYLALLIYYITLTTDN